MAQRIRRVPPPSIGAPTETSRIATREEGPAERAVL